MNSLASRISYFKELSNMRRRMMSSFKDSAKVEAISRRCLRRKRARSRKFQFVCLRRLFRMDMWKELLKNQFRVLDLFERYGNSEYTIGEPMTITEHSVQTAYAARDEGENEEAQLSCLLHDVGHLCGLEAHREPGMDGCGTEDHERGRSRVLGISGLLSSCFLLGTSSRECQALSLCCRSTV